MVEMPAQPDTRPHDLRLENVTKRYGDKFAVDDLELPGEAGGRDRLPRTQRRGQVDDDADDPRARRATSGSVTINGRSYLDLRAPLHEVGAMLEARAIHTGRSAYNHLLALAQTHGIAARRVDEVIELVGLAASPASASAASRSAWASGSASRRRCSATRRVVILDEPANGLDPEGILWIRTLLKRLADRGPDGVPVLAPDERDGADRRAPGRHRPRPADRRHHASPSSSRRPPPAPPCASARRTSTELPATRWRARGVRIAAPTRGVLEVHGLTRPADRRDRRRDSDRAARADAAQASLEDAFMALTGEAVEYHAGALRPPTTPTGGGRA